MSERIDETIPGGYYIGPDGVPHDAHGRPIEAVPEPEPDTDKSSAAERDPAENAVESLSEPEQPIEAVPEPEPKQTKRGKGK